MKCSLVALTAVSTILSNSSPVLAIDSGRKLAVGANVPFPATEEDGESRRSFYRDVDIGRPSVVDDDFEPIIFPMKRFGKDFMSLDGITMSMAEDLSYTNDEWDLNFARAGIEMLSYDVLMNNVTLNEDQMLAVSSLVDNGASWDCWINHYEDYWWWELPEAVLAAYSLLGWNETNWEWDEATMPMPATEENSWDRLTEEQQVIVLNATCWNELLWDEIPLFFWVGENVDLAADNVTNADFATDNATFTEEESPPEGDGALIGGAGGGNMAEIPGI